MNKFKPVLAFSLIAFTVISFIYQGCNGIFPTETKPNVPSDHTSDFGGYLHKGGRQGESEVDDCKECHGDDLRGKLYNYNGTWIITSSCYQCHGNVWERGGG